jgi:glycosyltransferase involved in cell wall biosynthesis
LPVDRNGFIGKGADRMLELFSRLPEMPKILIASTKPNSYDKLLQKYIKNVSKIENAERQKVGSELASSKISFHPSRCEACQLTLIEAMMMKNVVITFPIGAAEELVKNGENGFIVNSVKEAVEIINKISKNPEEMERVASNARNKILIELSADKIGSKYLSIFQKISQER